MSRVIAPALTIVAAAMLAACGGGNAENADNAAAAEAAVNETASEAVVANETAAAVPAAAAAGGAPTADYMIGKWSAMDEDCTDTLEFRKDGSVATPFGEGKWTLAGDQLSVDFGEGGKMDPSTIKVLSQDRIEISKKSGGKQTEKRCP